MHLICVFAPWCFDGHGIGRGRGLEPKLFVFSRVLYIYL